MPPRSRGQLFALCLGVGLLGRFCLLTGVAADDLNQQALLSEIERLRNEVQRLKTEPQPAPPPPQASPTDIANLQVQRELEELRNSIANLAGGGAGGGAAAAAPNLAGAGRTDGVAANSVMPGGFGNGFSGGGFGGGGFGGGVAGGPGMGMAGGITGMAGMAGMQGMQGMAGMQGAQGVRATEGQGVAGMQGLPQNTGMGMGMAGGSLGMAGGGGMPTGLGTSGGGGNLGGLGALGGASAGSRSGLAGTSAADLLGALDGAGLGRTEDGCTTNPLFVRLHRALQKLALLEEDPVEASFQIHEAWEDDPKIMDECPVGLVTALVYLSIAQDRDWKYRLLHRATFLLYSTPGLGVEIAKAKWPMSDRLIRTMYYNSESQGRTPLKFTDDVAQPPRGINQDVSESVELSIQHQDTVRVHFARVLFYHFYHEESAPCACRTRSWCLARWTRHLTNASVDVWLAGRDERKTLYRMDKSGCFQNLGIGLATHIIADTFDFMFVFEINALMHPQCRVISALRTVLYPTFDLSDQQVANFEELGVSVLPDDVVLKPPNPAMRQIIDRAFEDRQMKMKRPKDRLLLVPADIRPLKGQMDLLSALVMETAVYPAQLRRLKGLTIVIAGGCDGNQTYCAEVVQLTQKVNAEGELNIVIADQLKDEDMAQLYAASLGVVLYSRIDCNPRAVFEGFVADTPFFVTDKARLPALVQHLGHVSDGNAARLPEQLADFVDFAWAGGFASRPREFAQRHLVEADVYRKVLEWMNRKYTTGKVVESVIRSEDALSGAFGGLGGAGGLAAMLGGFTGAGDAGALR